MVEMSVRERQDRAARLWELVPAVGRCPGLADGREFHRLAAEVRRDGCRYGLAALAEIERAVASPGFALAVGGR